MKTDGSDQNTKGQNGTGGQLSARTGEFATLRGELQKMTAEFSKALAGKITPERMARIVMTAAQTTPKLAECSRASFFGAVLQSCQLALEPNTPLGQAYLIPRWNGAKKRLECNFQIGYQGLLELAYRSAQYKRITSEVVYEGDEFFYEYGTDSYLRHKPAGTNEKPVFVYALCELVNGGRMFKVWTWGAVMKHAEQFSESFDKSFSPWKSNQESREAMARKTVLISLLKYAPKSAEVASAVNSDERVINMRRVEDGNESFISFDIDIPPETTEATPEKETAPAGKTETARRERQAEETARPTSSGAGKTMPETSGNAGNGNGDFFDRDEEEALAERYERQRQAGFDGPDFG
jgi:recombination protein RecT